MDNEIMKPAGCFTLLFLFSVEFSAAFDWPPSEIAGGWLVTSSSVDDESDVIRGELLFIFINDRVVLAESFPDDELEPYATSFRISEVSSVKQSHSGQIHIPAVDRSCFYAGHGKTVKSISITQERHNGKDCLRVVLDDLEVKAKRVVRGDEVTRIRSLLRAPKLECDTAVRELLTDYLAEPISR